jgi:AbrB family looped-hinge helix DNA binding protein
MSSVSVSSKGQVVIPKDLRERLGIRAGTRLEVSEVAGEVRMRLARRPGKTATLEEGVGLARYMGPPKTIEEMNAGVRRHFRRTWPKSSRGQHR